MRVYCFCPETGIYQGEDFYEGSHPQETEGMTDIAPPPYSPGEVPVFDMSLRGWTIKRTTLFPGGRSMAPC
jgi:hypothetical protein